MNGGLQQQGNGTTVLIPLRHHYIPNAKQTPELATAAKQEHVQVFALLSQAPPGFELAGDDEFMFAFHAAVDENSNLHAFAHPK